MQNIGVSILFLVFSVQHRHRATLRTVKKKSVKKPDMVLRTLVRFSRDGRSEEDLLTCRPSGGGQKQAYSAGSATGYASVMLERFDSCIIYLRGPPEIWTQRGLWQSNKIQWILELFPLSSIRRLIAMRKA